LYADLADGLTMGEKDCMLGSVALHPTYFSTQGHKIKNVSQKPGFFEKPGFFTGSFPALVPLAGNKDFFPF
jgi:hypothetical protein